MNQNALAFSHAASHSMPHSHSRLKPKTKGKKITAKTRKQRKLEDIAQKNHWVSAIKVVEGQLKEAYRRFNEVTDPDLVDSSIFEINALQAQHNYLTRKLRAISHGSSS